MTAYEIAELHHTLLGHEGGNFYYGRGESFMSRNRDYLIFWQLVALSEGVYRG